MKTLTLTIKIAEGDERGNKFSESSEEKYAGFTFVNGTGKYITATDEDGNTWLVKTLFNPPKKEEKKDKVAKAKAESEDRTLMQTMLDEMRAIRAENKQLRESLPLKSGRKDLAQPAVQAVTKGNGVVHG